jgi:DmsE family decaheme c-type cytochrome
MRRRLRSVSPVVRWVGPAAIMVSFVALARLAPMAAQPEEMAPAKEYVGSDVCISCHPDPVKGMEKTAHGQLIIRHPKTEAEKRGCEACHGPGSAHVADVTNPAKRLLFSKSSKATAREKNARCLQCHTKGEHLFWKGSTHEMRDLACARCHSVHAPASQQAQLTTKTEMELCEQCHVVKKAQMLRSSHMPLREGKMKCTDCHNPHGSITAKLIRGNSVNELCFKCHAEKRGPFLWEHPPVRENCLNCHLPHGSIHDKLLKVKRPRLCQQCHIPTRHPTETHSPADRFTFNRSCLNCHPTIHGSNHPGGMFFTR